MSCTNNIPLGMFLKTKKPQFITKRFCGVFSAFPTIDFCATGSRFEQLKMEVRKGSMVNVNPTNTRPPNDTPEIRKYKKRFNSEILCAALWGEKKWLYWGRTVEEYNLREH